MVRAYDYLIIGGGVVGASVLNKLSFYNLSVCVLEGETDFCEGTSKANSGIVHGGYDCHEGTIKAKVNVLGNKLIELHSKRLGVHYSKVGSLVVGGKNDLVRLEKLLEQGVKNGVEDLKIINRLEVLKLEPNVADDVEYALFCKNSGIISPYELNFALLEDAVNNGCEVFNDCKVIKIEKRQELFCVICENGREFYSKNLINSAGVNSAKINKLIDAEEHAVMYRRGEYLLLDKSEIGLVGRPIFPLPSEKGKGMLAIPTTHGNILLGPTAEDSEMPNKITSFEGLSSIKNQLRNIIKNFNLKKVIRVFSGIRTISGDDFVIEASKKVENFYYLIGICSPGLASSYGIAEYLFEKLNIDENLKKQEERITRKPITHSLHLSDEKFELQIKKDKRYANIVCRCENITEGDIVEVLNRKIKVKTTDGLKRIAGAGMGRCQGGFCLPKIIEIMARELKCEVEEISKRGKGSEIVICDIKEGGIYE